MLKRAIHPAPWGLSLDHPQWQCGMRPFFAAGTLLALLGMLLWLAFLVGGLPLPAAADRLGPFAWHGQTLLMGLGLAAVVGFVLTAVPEFTATPGCEPRRVRALFLCWLTGFVASQWAGPVALLLGALGWTALLLGTLAWAAPRLWRDPARAQLAFGWALLALTAVVLGWHVDAWRGAPLSRWLDALLGVQMALMVVALSRISMRIVNRSLDDLHAAQRRAGLPVGDTVYLARPPRRQLALITIGLFTATQWAAPGERVTGWLALAAAAALAHLLNDWHVGRALLHRRPLMLYAVYVSMALGYTGLGLGALAGQAGWTSAGRHLLAVSAFGLGILAVFAIAGRTHAGWPDERRAWLPAAAAALLLAGAARAGAAFGLAPVMLLVVAALAWLAAWGAVAVWLLPLWQAERPDGRRGCDEPDEAGSGC
ncbi:MAG: NnrS family protein [Burkholderiales bacterium]|jgi:uncharacterized protein involved in response to NO|nr:NnrS family protein [Burkholderiales bacterium]